MSRKVIIHHIISISEKCTQIELRKREDSVNVFQCRKSSKMQALPLQALDIFE